MKIKVKVSDRGFKFVDFEDLYGFPCSLQESSLATNGAIWFGCKSGSHYDRQDMSVELPSGAVNSCLARMHLSQKQVKQLLPVLEYFAKTGYLPEK